MSNALTLLGIDPGLRRTGWGVITSSGNHLRGVACGVIASDEKLAPAERLVQIHDGLRKVMELYHPDEAAVEETFVNKNPASALKLGLARGIALLVPALSGLAVAEYPANLIKKSVAGFGHADKVQIKTMVNLLLPGINPESADAADALAVAICHAHHRQTRELIGGIMAGAAR